MNLVRHISIVASLLLVGGCFFSSAGEFSVALGKKLQAERQPVIDLAKVTSFNWEELFIFGPYSSREENCKVLQLTGLECRLTVPASVDEGEYFLVFMERQKLVHSEHHHRSNGDFYSQESQRPQPVKRQSAQFNVVPTSSGAPYGVPWFRLEYAGQ